MEGVSLSPDFIKKLLYQNENKKVKKQLKLYFFSYFPTIKAEYQFIWFRQFFSLIAKIVILPTAFTIFKNYCLQGPRIYLLFMKHLTFSFLSGFSSISGGITVYIFSKWYAFFLFLELKKFYLLKLLCYENPTTGSKRTLIFLIYMNDSQSLHNRYITD